MTIIGIHFGHNATVALLEDGQITHCISEERLNRFKNSNGFPDLALAYILNKTKNPVDYYVFTQKYPWGYANLKANGFTQQPYTSALPPAPVEPLRLKLFPNNFYAHVLSEMKGSIEHIQKNTALQSEMEEYFSAKLGVPREKILYADHHLTHTLSTKFFEVNNNKKLIFTLDGEGDGLCATVSISDSNSLTTLSRVNKAFSLGYLYREVTAFLGMKPDEHEFKVMGLAPYAKKEHVKKLLPIFEKILWLNTDAEFESHIPMPTVKYYLSKNLSYKRFDTIAGAVQMFSEHIVCEWIARWIKKTGIHDIGLSGGVFMNVKMNQKIGEMDEVHSLTIVPSAGDESTVFGGCYYGFEKLCADRNIPCTVTKVDTLYLGTEYSDSEIETYLHGKNKTNTDYFKKYTISKPDNMATTLARLLSENTVVARFAGRMEFGARALGNRSILANPAHYENIRIINEMIKNRDFWMPFATSILEEDASTYLHNPKHIDGSYMIITFDTTDEAHRDLTGAIHPYDKTSRPQIVTKNRNPEYHSIISEFKKITGSGGILNTSFNLHGEPNVESPEDALHTFEHSGLPHLALGSFLISKKT